MTELKVSFPFSTELSQFDPARVEMAHQYFFLENLYSQLLERDNSGQLKASLASKFGWDDNRIFFELRPGLLASDGKPITIRDVYFSFMRLLVLGTSTHSDLAKILGHRHPPKTIQEGCNGIILKDNTLVICPKEKNFAIFDTFTTIDLSIIPERAVDQQTLAISNYAITSGPYSVLTRNQNGAIRIVANTQHIQYRNEMPQRAVFIPAVDDDTDSLGHLEKGKIDFISTVESIDVTEANDTPRGKPRGLMVLSSGYSLRFALGNNSAWTGPSFVFSSCDSM